MGVKWLALGIAFAFSSACTSQINNPAQEAEAAFADYVEAINDGETEAIASMYDANPGFHWVEQGTVQYTSGDEAAASFDALTASGMTAQMTTDTMQIAVLSDTSALISTHFDFALSDASGEEQFAFDGWMTVGMVKRENGWKIAGGQTGPGRANTVAE